MSGKRRALWLLALAVPAAAGAVGMGPLRKDGITDGPRKGFWLTVSNGSPVAETYRLHPLQLGAETAAPRVAVLPDSVTLGPASQRRVLVVASDLKIGETYRFRVCAGRDPNERETVYARICSTLSATRVDPARRAGTGGNFDRLSRKR